MVLTRERVLTVLRQKGPSVPAELTSALGENTIIVGAFLSELIANKDVAVTQLKIGGSRLYFTPEHRPQIVRLRAHLNDKDKGAFDMLSEQKIVRDDTLSPLERTCMRNLTDFALPVRVKYSGQDILFWRWFLTSQEEAQEKIKSSLQINEIAEPETKQEQVTQPETPAEPIAPKSIEEVKHDKKPVVEQQQLLPPQNTPQLKDDGKSDAFLDQMTSFLNDKQIQILASQVVRANNELDLLVSLTSGVGELQYFARAKKKKLCNDGDLAAAMIQGQLRHLPVLFICTGKLTKKAKSMLTKEFSMLKVVENAS